MTISAPQQSRSVSRAATRLAAGVAVAVCAATVAARPAAAGVLLDFNFVPNAASAAHFEVVIPPDPIVPPDPVVPVELLTLSLVGASQAGGDLSVALVGRDSGPAGGGGGAMGIVDVNQVAGVEPTPFQPISFALLLDVAPFMGSNPVAGIDPTPFWPDAVSMFDVRFDVMIDGVIAHHLASFTAPGEQLFDNITVMPGSVAIGFDLIGPFEDRLFTATLTGSAERVPTPSGVALLGIGLAVLALIRLPGPPRMEATRGPCGNWANESAPLEKV